MGKMHFLFDLSERISLKINAYQIFSVKQNCEFVFFSDFFGCGGGSKRGNLPFSQLSVIMAETMQKRGILPHFVPLAPLPQCKT